MDPIITQGPSQAIYATFTFTNQATKDVHLQGRKVIGVAIDANTDLNSATTFDIYPYGLNVTSSNTTIGSLSVGKVFYNSNYPRLNRAVIKFNAAVTGDVTLILE